MNRTFLSAVLSVLLVFTGSAQTPPVGGVGVVPNACLDQVPAIPAACDPTRATRAGTWGGATDCLDALVATYPALFPGAVIGRQQDGAVPANVYAKGAGFGNNSVVNLASVSKPLVKVGLVKVVQDHFASSDCSPNVTPRCVFPQKFDTTLAHAIRVLDQRRGTDVRTRWFERVVTDDAQQQRDWKNAIKIKDILLMTSGFPPISFTGYRFCPGPDCADIGTYDYECNPTIPSSDPDQLTACRYAQLYNQYLSRRGGSGAALPNACRPRPVSGTRLFNFNNYYNGQVDAAYRLSRQFERRYSFEPGLFGECVLTEDANGVGRWADGRTIKENDVAKFFLGMPLLGKPGTYHYSQPNLYVTSFLIEGVTGQRFDAYLKSAIFTPVGMNDTSFVITPGSSQYQRLRDIVRVPTSPDRTLPDIAAPLTLDTIYGADKEWDEPREGWVNRWPEGGGYSTAGDLLRFLRFIDDGKAANGNALLNPESLGLVSPPVVPDTPTVSYAFGSTAPGLLTNNGYFATYVRRNLNTCYNATVLMQIITESPEAAEHRVQLCDYQYRDIMALRGALINMIDAIPSSCGPAAATAPETIDSAF